MPIQSEFPPVPVATEPLSRTFLDAIRKHFLSDPTRIAMINANDEFDRITFSELYTHSQTIGAFFEAHGFSRGDVICTVLPNSWQFIVTLIGVSLCGMTLSPASQMFTHYELEQQFLDSGSKIIFCSDANLALVLRATQNVTSVTTIIVMAEARSAPKPLPPAGSAIEFFYFHNILAHSMPFKQHAHIDVERDVFLLPYSSGTTGSPKGVILSHRNVGTMVTIFNNHFKEYILKYLKPNIELTREYSLMMLPFYHIYGLVITVIELINGTPIVFMRHFDPHVFCTTIQKYRIPILKLVPPILIFLAKHPIAKQYDLSSVVFIFSGAAPMGPDLCEELIKKYPNLISVAQGYGMTELSLGCLFPSLKDGKNRYESSGKLASNFEMKVVDIETGLEVERGRPGELFFRSPTVMIGYLNRAEATAETIDKDGWLRSGDVGIVDNDGFVSIVDRRKELIKVKGYQVPPAELEGVLLTHPQIKDCAVVGVPDGKIDEMPKAYVVRSAVTLTENDVRNYIKERVAPYKQLRGGVEFVDEIPKSPSGKILRRFLQEHHRKTTSKI